MSAGTDRLLTEMGNPNGRFDQGLLVSSGSPAVDSLGVLAVSR